MIPNIFVSSTINDLRHIREAIRDTISELGYNPIMSEYGDIGYLPSVSVEVSCYVSLGDCQLAVLIIGKRYGSLSNNGLSLTHKEFKEIKKNEIPLICLVDQEVVTYKKVFDINKPKRKKQEFPGMDNPQLTFNLIDEFINSKVNNGFLVFSNISEARFHFKRQLSHLFGALLRKNFDPLKSNIQDVLSEIKTLKYELLKYKKKDDYLPFLFAVRLLMEDKYSFLKLIIEQFFPVFEDSISKLLSSKNFLEFLKKSRIVFIIKENNYQFPEKLLNTGLRYVSAFLDDEFGIPDERNAKINSFGISIDNKLILKKSSANYFDNLFNELKDKINEYLKIL